MVTQYCRIKTPRVLIHVVMFYYLWINIPTVDSETDSPTPNNALL